MTTALHYTDPATALNGASILILVGRRARLLDDDVRALLPEDTAAVWETLVDSVQSGDAGGSASTFSSSGGLTRVVAGVLPEPCSRHNSPARPHAVTSLVAGGLNGKGEVAVFCALDDETHAYAAGCAVARALPVYSRKTGSDEGEEGVRPVRVAFLAPGGAGQAARVPAVAEGIRLAARLTDTPCSELDTEAFVDAAERIAVELGVGITLIRGEELRDQGFGGLWGVGKAAIKGPALVVLSHEPKGAERSVAWVGKGIVYDTGGLSIKGKDHMPGMKADMGGAAAVLGAFRAAVQLGVPTRVHAVLCLAENAVGPIAMRPDDILEMYSGKTVEVNNTDAEGRLVLADGVAYAGKHLDVDTIIDLATLTGAQLLATGKRHAGIVCNDDALEASVIESGRYTGDLVHPLPYVPEFFRKEFRSKVADLKNSVKDRMNAQASCAAQFVAEHLGDYEGPWLHVDLAGPSSSDERGTGYGVALLVDLLYR